MDKLRNSKFVRKSLVFASVAFVAVILVVSAVVLVRNARLQQTDKPVAVGATKPLLSVVPSSETSLPTASDDSASSSLQGSPVTSAPETNTLPKSESLKVDPAPALEDRTCDMTRKARLLDDYTSKKDRENTYHLQLLKALSLESILVQSGEQTRHNNELSKLEKTLTQSLSAIFCSR